MTITVTLTLSGSNTGPFSLYSDLDGFTTPFVTGVARASLIAGYTTAACPDWTNTVRIQSTGDCTNYIDVTVTPYTTTTSTSSTTTTTTTIAESTKMVGLRFTTSLDGDCADSNTDWIQNYIYVGYDASLFELGGDSKYNVITNYPNLIATSVNVYNYGELLISDYSPIAYPNTVDALNALHAGTYVIYYDDVSDPTLTAYLTLTWNGSRLEASLEVCAPTTTTTTTLP